MANPANALWELWANGQQPNLTAFLSLAGPLSLEELAKVVRIDQRQRWQIGEKVWVEEYFRKHPGLQTDPEMALNLISHEFLLREKLGQGPDPHEYYRRFPDHAAVLTEQIELHRVLEPESQSETAEGAILKPSILQQPSLTHTSGDCGTGSRAAAPPISAQQGDFLLLGKLGSGGFAQVYLANQISLNRKVALKVTKREDRGEARILASLEHDNIVKVYSEFDNPATGEHGLVLQYVPGTDLAHVLALLFQHGKQPTHSQAILEAVDQLAKDKVEFDPEALGDRELYRRGNYVTTVCRLGARLAEALAFAHSQGILHCDIKPANILLNRYGRPMLADFNVAVPLYWEESDHHIKGGTVRYMAPEQLAVFARRPKADIRQVDQRADLYSLGLVLLEAIVGHLPTMDLKGGKTDLLEAWWSVKSQSPEQWLAREQAKGPQLVWQVLRRCLDPDPGKRFANGRELAAALSTAADLLESQLNFPPLGWLGGLAWRRPLTALIMFALLPHLISTGVNIAYNTVQISLTPVQKETFNQIIIGYNLLVYPLCLAVVIAVLRPLATILRRPELLFVLPTTRLDHLRARALNLGRWISILALLGWLPGGIVFPFALEVLTGPVAWIIYSHYFISFALSGIIGLIYSYMGIQFVVLRSLCPRLLHAEQKLQNVGQELKWILGALGLLPVLAAVVPLTGAVLLVVLAPSEFHLGFRLLVTALIVAGMLGLGVTLAVTQFLRKLAFILMGVQPFPTGSERVISS